jgi:hypothetical protein
MNKFDQSKIADDVELIPFTSNIVQSLRSKIFSDDTLDLTKFSAIIFSQTKNFREASNINGLKLSELTAEDIEVALRNISDEGLLEDFILKYAENLYFSGLAKPKHINEKTYSFLIFVGEQLKQIVSDSYELTTPVSNGKVSKLRELDRKILEFAQISDFIKAPDYVSLNQQHKVIASLIKQEEHVILERVGKKEKEFILTKGIFTKSELNKLSPTVLKGVEHLIDAGIINSSEHPLTGVTYCYAHASISSQRLESVIPPRLREKIGEELFKEFTTKYSGKFRPIGISDNRQLGVPTVLDRIRVNSVAKNAGVSASHVVLFLKYLEQFGNLVQTDHSGYRLGLLANQAGLGFRTVRFMEKFNAKKSSLPQTDIPAEEVSLETYLNAARILKASLKIPTYTYETASGGLPPIYFLDELLVGNARIDTELLEKLVHRIKDDESALVIAANMLQGDPAVEPRGMRTSIPPALTDGIDMRDYKNQLPFLKALIKELNKPSMILHGKNDHLTAQIRADIEREKILHESKISESEIDNKLASDNPVTERARRKYNAKLQAELHDFISNIVQPFEAKLGRQLFETNEIFKRTGLRISEIEIVRDMVDLLLQDATEGNNLGRDKIDEVYKDFLVQPDIGNNYIFRLEQVLFPEYERLAPGEIIARGGAYIQFTNPEKETGLKLLLQPEARLGVGEVINPTEKLVSILKSAAAGGEQIADVVMVGSTAETFLSMMANGTLIVSASTLQSSYFDSSYFFTESSDRHKRRLYSKGGQNFAGAFSISGGIDENQKTFAYAVSLTNHKIEQVLAKNALENKPSKYVDIYATSDWQTGSPTQRPQTWLRGLMWAVLNGQKEIVINGDVLQGQNYGRAVAEMQLTGLVGIEDQQEFVSELIKPVLDMIKELKTKDPSFELPTFRIITGNHETNSQSNKGGQGIWFLLSLANQIQYFYRGAFGQDAADTKVLYPRKFVDHHGTDVDYSHMIIDLTQETGFRIAAQHYVGVGGKGSSSVTPAAGMAKWARSMEHFVGDIHGCIWAHFHTQSVVQRDGIFHVIFGANAGGSGFEHHLGYPTTVPASGRIRLYSDRPPELLFITEPYLNLAEKEFSQSDTYQSLIQKYGSLEIFIEFTRAKIQRRDKGSYSYQKNVVNI